MLHKDFLDLRKYLKHVDLFYLVRAIQLICVAVFCILSVLTTAISRLAPIANGLAGQDALAVDVAVLILLLLLPLLNTVTINMTSIITTTSN